MKDWESSGGIVGKMASDCTSNQVAIPQGPLFSDIAEVQPMAKGIHAACMPAGKENAFIELLLCAIGIMPVSVSMASFNPPDNPMRYYSHFADIETDTQAELIIQSHTVRGRSRICLRSFIF